MTIRKTLQALLIAVPLLVSCGERSPQSSNAGTGSSPSGGSTGADGNEPSASPPQVITAHGGATATLTEGSTRNGEGASGAASEKPSLETPELDEKIRKAEARAKTPSASGADKAATASAYLERANQYYNAGVPQLYKFALGDFRRVLKYQPDNQEALDKSNMIISIYQQMGRPVPSNGTEP